MMGADQGLKLRQDGHPGIHNMGMSMAAIAVPGDLGSAERAWPNTRPSRARAASAPGWHDPIETIGENAIRRTIEVDQGNRWNDDVRIVPATGLD